VTVKKVLIVVAAVALVVWVISWFRSPEDAAAAGARPWPGGLGRLDTVSPRSSSQQANEASRN
jgi:hypothetical protein